MKRNKKLLVSFLALNAILTSYAQAETVQSARYERMYNSIVKNMEKGSSNEQTYQTIQRILNQKNKELKDLYLQGDYIVKPEYLEWQVFFTGFYEEYNEGVDNTKENAKYHSNPLYAQSGYYDANGDYIVTSYLKNGISGKPLTPDQVPKEVELGIRIPLKGTNRQPLNLNIGTPQVPNIVTPTGVNITAPFVSIPTISVPVFTPVTVNVQPVTTNTITTKTFVFGPSGNGDAQWITNNGSNGPLSQINLDGSQGMGTRGSMDVISRSTTNTNWNFDLHLADTDAKGVDKQAHVVTNYGIQNINFTNQTQRSAMKLVGGHDITISDMDINFVGSNSAAGNMMLFHTDAHNNYNDNSSLYRSSSWILTSSTNVRMKGQNGLMFGVQYHGNVTDSGMVNNGHIWADTDTSYIYNATTYTIDPRDRTIFYTIDDGRTPNRYLYFENNGIIDLDGPIDILGIYDVNGAVNGGSYFLNSSTGNININGLGALGIVVNDIRTMGGSYINFVKPIELTGDNTVGAVINNSSFSPSLSSININIGNTANKSATIGNALGNNVNLVEGAVGIFTDRATLTVTADNNKASKNIGEHDVFFGNFANQSSLFRADGGTMTIMGIAEVDAGTSNLGMVATGTGTVTLASTGTLLISGGTDTIGNIITNSNNSGAYAQNNGNIINNGTIKSIGIGTNAIISGTSGIVTNNGIIEKSNNGGAVILSGGSFTNTANGVIITKNGSAGVYSDITAAPVINGGVLLSSLSGVPYSAYHADYGTKNTGIIADNGGIAYYSGVNTGVSTGNITVSGTNTTIMNGGLMFYNQYKTGAALGTYGKFNIASGAGITVEDGGTVFNFDGTPSGAYFTYSATDFSDYITNTFTNISNLNINMPTTAGEYGNLFVLNKTIFNLTTANTAIGSIAGLGLSINPGGNYRFGLVANGKLNIDNDSSIGSVSNPYNLDNPLDSTNKVSVVSSEIEVTSGTYVKGTLAGQILAKMANPDNTAAGQAKIAIVNNGNIDMSGTNSISFYSRYGIVTNNNIINSSNGAIGIYGTNNTQINNVGTINLGNNSIGLAAKTQEGTLSIAGNNLINMTNSGNIISNGATAPIGMYAQNNSSLNRADANITNSNTVDLRNSLNSIGAYISGGTFTNTGSMSVGTNGIAVLADMTDVNMSGGTINLTGNKAVGFHLENGSNITGATGTVNVDGTDIVIFNIKGSSAPIPNGLTINPTAGSTYILANIDEGLFTTGAGTLTAGANSVLISGTKSGVMIGAGTVVTSTGTNSVALSADQVSTPPLILPYSVEAENQGTIALGDNSAAIYVSNGASGLNSANITVGDNSVGIFGKNGMGTIKNNGVITVGQSSQGLYAEGIAQVENTNMINGTMANSVGMYASGVTPMLNSGTIDLSGVDSIGMFSVASPGSTAVIWNTGTGKIKIGNSTNPSNPAVGIYSENEDEVIINDGEIEVGSGSLGIYKFGHPTLSGTIQQNGKITVGSGGVGIYSNGDLVTLSPTSQIMLQGNNEAVGVYGTNNSVITNTSSNLSIGSNNYGVVLETGAGFVNNAAINMGTNEVLVYSTGGGTITNNFPITMTGDENVAVYATNGEYVSNTSVIDATGKIGNIGIYNKNGYILSTGAGKIYVGNSNVPVPSNPSDPSNKYAVGLYGEGAKIENHSDIEVGAGGIGIYIKDNNTATIAENYGHIILNGAGAIGLYAENGIIINEGTIDVNGNDGIGMAGVTSTLINGNSGIINLNADNGIGIYGNTGGSIENKGTINIGSGNNNIGIGKGSGTDIVSAGGLFGEGTVLGNTTINGNKVISSMGNSYPTPSIVNSGVINVSEYFSNEGVVVAIKVDPSTIRPAAAGSADDGAKFVADSVQINAPYFSVSEENPVQILASFTQGTNANVYKLKDVFNPTTPGGGPNSGTVHVISKSLTWRATPEVNSLGNIDIWMEKIPYDDFTNGLWYEDFGLALDSKYGTDGISDKAIEIFNKIDMIETDQEPEFRRVMASLAGNVYANINQREDDIAKTFENSLHLLQDSTNNTKENVKISVIAGKGKNKEETDGATGYDYTTTGVLALREVERTYKHTFGYSLGYVHTGFEFKDGNESEEWVDTIQLGVHNKYRSNGWKIVNDLTGRASIHNVDRNIDWPSPNSRSEMNGTYETYSITSDNILGKEFGLGKKASIMPYGAFRAMYVTRPTFNESGLEALEVEGNDAWSAKPRAGVELKGAIPLGAKTAWQLKGTLDLAYEYELADLNEREKARLVAIEDGYHKLSKPEDEKGTFRTKAAIGVEVEDRYGIFLTGEYSTGNDKENDYRAGVTLKAVF